MSRRRTAARVAFFAVGALTIAAAVYIMVRRIGLNPELDFGAGAYYYADIPTEQYTEIVNEDAYQTSVPKWIFYVLFFAWGWLMWRLWVWIETRGKK